MLHNATGIISLSGMLQALGKDVTLLVDERGIETYKYVAKEVKAGLCVSHSEKLEPK